MLMLFCYYVSLVTFLFVGIFFFKQKTAYEMRISDWSSDVCSSDLETVVFCDLLRQVYRDFGFEDLVVKFSDRPAVRAGDDATWDKAEGALKAAVEEAGLDYTLNPGEGAFYGPKLEFVLRDAIGRDWQCGTFQVDFVLPERLGASYVGEDGEKSEEHTSELQSLMRISYAVFCLKKKNN